MSPEDAFRRVLAARLPAGPGWTAWIDGTAAELAASVDGVTLTPEEVRMCASCGSTNNNGISCFACGRSDTDE